MNTQIYQLLQDISVIVSLVFALYKFGARLTKPIIRWAEETTMILKDHEYRLVRLEKASKDKTE